MLQSWQISSASLWQLPNKKSFSVQERPGDATRATIATGWLDAIGAVAGGVWELARSTSVQLGATSLAALLVEGTAGGKD